MAEQEAGGETTFEDQFVESFTNFLSALTGGQCSLLGSGYCCRDVHFDRLAVPEAVKPMFDSRLAPESLTVCDQVRANTTAEKSEVTCNLCKEVLNA